MKIKFKKLTKEAKTPFHGSDFAAGYDLTAAIKQNESLRIEPNETVFISTGIAVEIPDGYWGGIYARSGMACKRHLRPANCVGVIDSDYRGEIKVCLHNDGKEPQIITNETKIAQLIISPYVQCEFEEVGDLLDTERNDKGFGSSGM